MNGDHLRARCEKITRDFRRYATGRLYWRHKHQGWKTWDTADVARVKNRDGTTETFTGLDQIEAYIVDCLAYPDDRTTRDFSNGRAEKKPRRRFLGGLKLYTVEPETLDPCGRCGEDTLITVQVEVAQGNGDLVFEIYHRCITCQFNDNATLDNMYWYMNRHDENFL